MTKIANFISFSIAQDPSKFSIFTYTDQKDWLKFLTPNLNLQFSINCGQELCNRSSSFVKITLLSDFDYLMFNIPLKASAQYEMGKFLSKS